MKRGGEQQSTQGFTIVETMIVLAVTASLFVLAALTVSGKQNKTDFQIGSRALLTQVQKVINETATGYYPSSELFTCSEASAGGKKNVTIATSAINEQGSNSECIFAGKVMAFSNVEPGFYSLYSLAGRRIVAGDDVKTAADAWLTVIPTSTLTVAIPNGLEYVGAVDSTSANPTATNTNGFGVAFLSSFADFPTTDSGATGGLQQVGLNRFSSSWPAATTSSAGAAFINGESNINSGIPYPAVSADIMLCFRSGGTDQSALISITPSLDASLEIKNGTTCGGII